MTFASLLLLVLAANPSDEVVARVDGVAVTRSTVLRKSAAVASATPAQVVEGCIAEALLAAEGRRLGLVRDPAVLARIDRDRRRAAMESLVEKELAPHSDPPESTLREMFQTLNDGLVFESATFETREAADAARQRIEKGSTLVAEARTAVMSRVPPDPEAAQVVMRGQLDATLADALFAAGAGKLAGPVQLPVGWAIARAVRMERGTEEAYRSRRDALVKRARALGKADAVRHISAQLRAKSGVTLDEAFLRALHGSDATPQQLDHVVANVRGYPLRYAEVYAQLAQLGTDGHMAGPNVKVQFAWQRVDALLLENLALERHHDAAPEVKARDAEFERGALAAAAAERIQAAAPPPSEGEIEAFYRRNADAFGKKFEAVLPAAAAGARNEKRARALVGRVTELRSKASVSVDQKALARAFAPAT